MRLRDPLRFRFDVLFFRNIFLGRLRLPMVEIAAVGALGLVQDLTLLNEHLGFEADRRGSLKLNLKWVFDVELDEENKKQLKNQQSIRHRLLQGALSVAKFLTRRKTIGAVSLCNGVLLFLFVLFHYFSFSYSFF